MPVVVDPALVQPAVKRIAVRQYIHVRLSQRVECKDQLRYDLDGTLLDIRKNPPCGWTDAGHADNAGSYRRFHKCVPASRNNNKHVGRQTVYDESEQADCYSSHGTHAYANLCGIKATYMVRIPMIVTIRMRTSPPPHAHRHFLLVNY